MTCLSFFVCVWQFNREPCKVTLRLAYLRQMGVPVFQEIKDSLRRLYLEDDRP
jgi:hypothetical protein